MSIETRRKKNNMKNSGKMYLYMLGGVTLRPCTLALYLILYFWFLSPVSIYSWHNFYTNPHTHTYIHIKIYCVLSYENVSSCSVANWRCPRVQMRPPIPLFSKGSLLEHDHDRNPLYQHHCLLPPLPTECHTRCSCPTTGGGVFGALSRPPVSTAGTRSWAQKLPQGPRIFLIRWKDRELPAAHSQHTTGGP